MVASNQNTDPLQKHKIYGVSTASMIESIIFLTLYGVLISDVVDERNRLPRWDPFRVSLESILNTCAVMVAVYAIRFLVAVALLKKSYQTSIIFYIATIVGIIINVVVGLKSLTYRHTYAIGVATLSVIGLHCIYLILIHGVIKKMRAELMEKLHNSPVPGYSPYGRPVMPHMRTVIFTLPPGQHAYQGYGQAPYPPYTTHGSNPCPYPTQSYPQAPPQYAAEFENGPDGPRKVTVATS